MDLFYALGAFHGLLFFITILVIAYSDHQGYLYFRGKKRTLSMTFVEWSHRLVWIGLLLIIVTGAALALPAYEYYLTVPAFYVKIGFVGVLVMNAFAIGALAKKASITPFSELSAEERKTLFISGALSFCCWIGAATIGFFIL